MSTPDTILAVDDNEVNLEVIQEALDGFYRVATATNGVDGIAIAKQLRPPVVLLDVMMPGLDGYQVCRQIKQSYELEGVRAIMVSARVALSDKLRGYDEGADGYIAKPFDEEELLAKLDFAIRARRLEQSCGAIGDVLAFVATLRDTGRLSSLDRTRAFNHLLAERTLDASPELLECRQEFLDHLHYACVLKDVGMLSIPVRIAEAADPVTLSRNDYELLKEHTLIGGRLLARMAKQHPDTTLFPMAAEVAQSHHERFDGSGYPEGLRGDEIPLSARIVAVVDRYESLLNAAGPGSRPGLNAVHKQLADDCGSLLDPDLTTRFLQVLDDLNRDSVVPSEILAQWH